MPDIERMKKLLLMALSSDHDNEMLIALHKLRRAIKDEGQDIHWFAEQLDQKVPFTLQAKPMHTPVATDWEDQLEFCAENIHELPPKHQEFILSIMSQKGRKTWWYPSPKQEDYLDAIYQKVSLRHRWGI